MTTHAPYNFVPLSDFVFTPDWGKHVSQDIPFKDGYCGTIDLTITTKTPLLIGGDRNKSKKENGADTIGKVKAFITPDGNYAIPGSSLRGMIRNVLTIASFGKMNRVNDDRFTVRDMHRRAYTNQITNFVRGHNGGIRFKVKTGFLQRSNDSWQLTPCEHARIESEHLNTYLNQNLPLNEHVDIKANGMSAKDKYDLWHEKGKALKNRFRVEAENFHNRNNGPNIEFSKVLFDQEGNKDGVLVFTEQMGNKHREFVFHTLEETKDIPETVLKDFMHVYAKTDHWKFLNSNNDAQNQHGIPVFYLGEPNNIQAIGLVQLLKIAAPKSIKGLIGNTSESHGNKEDPDLAELIFGHLEEHKDPKIKGLKARAHFGLATRSMDIDVQTITSDATILGEPKASFYPHYLEQGNNEASYLGPNGQYKTYLDRDAKVRGWKRYPIRKTVIIPTVPDGNNNYAVQTTLEQIPADTKFTSKLHIHNMKAEEIGALLWALEFGGRDNCCHSLGMAKSFGLGAIKIITDKISITANDPNADDIPDAGECLTAYKNLMECSIPNRSNSSELVELFALSDIEYGERLYQCNKKVYDSLILNPEKDIDEFVDVKKTIKPRGRGENRIPAPRQQKFVLRRHSAIGNFVDTPPVAPDAPVARVGSKVEHKRWPIYGEIIELLSNDGENPLVRDEQGRLHKRPLSDYIILD